MNEATGGLGDGAVLLDASTINLLASQSVFHALTRDFKDRSIAPYLQGILLRQIEDARLDRVEIESAYRLNHALSFLELWVLSEDVFVDVQALKSLESHYNHDNFRALHPLFKKTEINDQVRREAASRVAVFHHHLSTSDNALVQDVSLWGEGDLEANLKDDYYRKFSGPLADSRNSRARAMFYLEASHILNVPLFLHPKKSTHLKEMGQALQRSSSAVYEMLVDEVRRELRYEEHEIIVPPIADEIVRVAVERGISLVESAQEIRDLNELAALRKCVAKLCSLGSEGRNVELRLKIRNEGRRIAGRIEAQLNVQGRISRRKIEVAELPWIGPFLKAMSYKPIFFVRDFELYQRPYVALFSRWANEVRQRYD